VLLVVVVGFPGLARALVISEIHYHPPSGQENLEFIEVTNNAFSPEDISGWAFVEGIRFVFPAGTVLSRGEVLVVCADAAAVTAHYGISNVLGNYDGRLDAAGERVTLVNHAGVVRQSLRYSDDGKWPVAPDGAGHTLITTSLHLDTSEPESWTASLELGGSPGLANRFEDRPQFNEFVNIDVGDTWRYSKGTQPFSVPLLAWIEPAFDDSDWLVGPSGFGFGDDDDNTLLEDMRDNYSSIAVRKSFTLTEEDLGEDVYFIFSMDYDDGYCAFLNGLELARGNCPEQLRFDEVATRSHEASSFRPDFVDVPRKLLRVGENVLAIQGFNRPLSGSDFSLIPRWLKREARERPNLEPVGIVFNELYRGTGSQDAWVEIHNPEGVVRDLSGWRVTTDPEDATPYVFPDGTLLTPGAFLLLEAASSGLELSEPSVRLFLIRPNHVVATASVFNRDEIDGVDTAHFAEALYPDGALDAWWTEAPTPGGPNRVERVDSLVINEIYYNPPEDRFGEFLELYNRGDSPLDISGFRFTKGISFTFPAGTVVAAGAFVVLAEDSDLLSEHYDYAGAFGPYEGSLADGGENVRLVDRLENLVDEVRYFDGGRWSHWADGRGASLELIDPNQDNDFAAAWGVSDETGKAEWEEHRFRVEKHRAAVQSELHLFLVSRGVCLVDDVSIVTENFDENEVVALGAEWRFMKGTQPFSDTPLGWTQFEFDDSAWLVGPSGFGYADDDDTTLLDDMQNNYTTVAIRKRFEPSPAVLEGTHTLVLAINYDDGFCAYLNGEEVARSLCPDDAAWDSLATRSHEARGELEIPLPREALREGENVFAILGLNRLISDSDLTLSPRLVELIPAGLSSNLIPNSGFETDTEGWVLEGTHVHSRQTAADSHSGDGALELVATGKGDSRCNRIEIDTDPALESEAVYDVSLWTKWVRGASLLVLHGEFVPGDFPGGRDINLSANPLAARFRMTVPWNIGTPGAENSARRNFRAETGTDNLGPVISDVVHSPLSPEPGTPVRVSARVADADGVARVQVFYKEDGEEFVEYASVDLTSTVSMAEPLSGVTYGGDLASLSADPKQVTFYVEATDAAGNVGRFPVDAPERGLLFRTDGFVEQQLQLITSLSGRRTLATRPTHSNDLVDGTFVLDDEHVFYNIGVRYRGSPWGRSNQSYRLRFGEDELLGGMRRDLNVSNRDRTDGAAYFLIERTGVPDCPVASTDYKFARMRVNGADFGVPGVSEVLDRRFIETWYGEDASENGLVLKGTGRMSFNDTCVMAGWDEAAMHHRGENTENYRFYWFHTIHKNRDAWGQFMGDMRLLDAATTSDEEFDKVFESVIDVEASARVFAARVLMNDTDGLLVGNGHNGYIFFHPEDERWRYLPQDMGVGWRSQPGRLFFMRDRNMRRVMTHPRSLRVYYRVLNEFLHGYWSPEIAAPFLQLLATQGAGVGLSELNFIRTGQRAALLRLEAQVSVELRFTTNDGRDFAVGVDRVTLEGEAPVTLKNLLLRRNGGAAESFEPRWLSATTWEVTLPVADGPNTFELLGFDTQDVLAATTALTVRVTGESEFVRGDLNGDGRVNLQDVVSTLGYLFQSRFLSCVDAADFDDNGEAELVDAFGMLDFIFRRGAPPAAPYPGPGTDPTADTIECRF